MEFERKIESKDLLEKKSKFINWAAKKYKDSFKISIRIEYERVARKIISITEPLFEN